MTSLFTALVNDPQGHRARAMLGGALAGGLVAFSMPPWGWWPLAFVGIAVADRTIAARSLRLRAVVGAFFGAAWSLPSTAWMLAFTPPGYLLFGLSSAIFYALAFSLVPPDRGRSWALPAVLVLIAALQWSWPFGGVPLASLAISQAAGWFGPTARVFGSLGLVGLCGFCGVGLSALSERRWRPLSFAVAGILALIGLALIAPHGDVVGETRLAVVQGGGEQGTRALFTSSRAVFERHVAATELLDEPVDLILWPENVVTVADPFEDSVEFAELVALAQAEGAPILAGIVEQQPDTFFNASSVVELDGTSGDRYDKVRIVPFGEYVPFRSLVEWAAPDYLPRRSAIPGTEPAVVSAAEAEWGVSISWEIFFERRAWDAVQAGGEVLLNPTNGSSYSFTIVQSQQIASSQLRAHETGRWVAQAAPTGFSAIITPGGEIVERSDVSEARVIVGTVERRTGKTWAVQFRWWPTLIAAAAALLAAWGLHGRNARRATGEVDLNPERA